MSKIESINVKDLTLKNRAEHAQKLFRSAHNSLMDAADFMFDFENLGGAILEMKDDYEEIFRLSAAISILSDGLGRFHYDSQ